MQSTPSQLKNTMVRAGAGAGKTHGLVEKVVEVFKSFRNQGRSPRIILTTFTRKATQELKERLILRACTDKDAALLQFVSDPACLQISTIHGLLSMFLRQVGHLAGLDAGFQIVSEAEAMKQSRIALRQVMVENPRGLKWLETYGFERVLQMCNLFHEAASEMPTVRPGSLDDLESAFQIKANEWKQKLSLFASEVEQEIKEPSWLEFAAVMKSVAQSWNGDLSDLENLAKPRRSKKQADLEHWHDRADELIKPFKDFFKHDCWDRSLWPQMADSWREFQDIALEFRQKLTDLREGESRLRMSDLEYKSIEILRSKPFLGAVFADNWDYWMIDEYQDTSPLQVECLKALIGDRACYRVGDPQQSIYLFRGADVRVFEQAEDETRQQGGTMTELRRNYRSAPDLLLWINDFMSSVGPGFKPMEPKASPSIDPARTCVQMFRTADTNTELNAVVSRVGHLLSEGSRLEDICILGRTHRNLMEVSQRLKQFGYPTHVHSSRGFDSRREVQDAQALWKFLVNPHDNLNLLILFRSPWFYAADSQLTDWCSNRPQSLWRKVSGEKHESVERLRQVRTRLSQIGLSRAFEEALLEAGCLDLSLVHDPAGRKESNLWKLIAKSRELEKQGDLSALSLLSEGAGDNPLDSAEGDATSAQEPGCINLMTIHGSKGLEFTHVILPGLGEAPRTSVTPPFSAARGVFAFPIWNEKSNAFTQSPLDVVWNQEHAARELEEFDRWLYVALTRAKQTLTLTWSSPSRTSWAGRSVWFANPPGLYGKEGQYAYQIAEEFAEPVVYSGQEANVPMVRGSWTHKMNKRAAQSVTELVTASRNTEAGRSRDSSSWLKRIEAQSVGIRLHRALEGLKYGHPSDSVELDFVLSIKNPPMRRLIQEGETEWGFQVQTPSGVIEGQIDLWGKCDGKIFVIDYKSGSSDYKEEAFEQLSLYAWALRQFGHVEPIDLVVIYPRAQAVESRDFSADLFNRCEAKFRGS